MTLEAFYFKKITITSLMGYKLNHRSYEFKKN